MTQKCSFSRKKQETSFQIDDMPVGVSVDLHFSIGFNFARC